MLNLRTSRAQYQHNMWVSVCQTSKVLPITREILVSCVQNRHFVQVLVAACAWLSHITIADFISVFQNFSPSSTALTTKTTSFIYK